MHGGGAQLLHWRFNRNVTANEFSRKQYLALQYGSLVKMNVVPVTIGALAPTKDTLTSLT